MTKRVQDLTRAEVVAELRRIAAKLDGPLLATDLTDNLRFTVQRHYRSIDAARDAAKLPHPDLARRWSREILIAEIQRLHKAGVRITDLELTRCGHGDLVGAIRMYFAGLPAARRAARVPDPAPITGKKRLRWDEARVTAEIEELDRSGESIAASKVPTALLKAGQRYFGGWNGALEAAGFDPKDVQLVRGAYTEAELVDILRSLAKNEPEMPLTKLYEFKFYPAIVRVFGSVDAAIAKAKVGPDWPIRERGATMSRDAVLAAIWKREHEGKPTRRDDVIEEDHLLWHSGMVHFGEWRLAAEAAGVDLSDHNHRWTDQRLIEALRERASDGLSLRPADLLREDDKLYQSAIGHFGSYRAACQAARVKLPRSR